MKRVEEEKVPQNVREMPAADAEGNGFMQVALDITFTSLVGDDDGIAYTRVKGEYFIDDEDAE